MAKRQVTNIEVKKNNRNQIFRYICECKTVSNPDISYELKISLPTVTQNTKELIERGLIVEAGELQSTGGRRAKALAVSSNARLAVGLDITKNHISLVLTNLVGDILKYQRFSQPFEPKADYYLDVNKKLEGFLKESGAELDRILGLGISFPGIVNLDRNVITYSHVLGVEEIELNSVSSYFSYPCCFFNDANAGAYAEGIHAKTADRFFYLSLSNTVGGAVISHHELTQGKNFRCGEVGHMTIVPDGEQCYCGKAGCLDVYCSAKRLSERWEKKLEYFFSALDQGEKAAMDVWNRYTSYLAVAVNNIHMVLDCDIILGGYVGSCLEGHMDMIRCKVLERNTFSEDSTFVKPCHYKVGAAALGAARKIIQTFIGQV